MNDLDRALADIVEIRSRIAQASEFRGLGPAALAATGGLAFAVATLQALLPGGSAPVVYFAAWTLTAIAAVVLLAAEMLRRADRHGSRLDDQMIREAAFGFVPAGVAGAALLAFMALYVPEALWMVPGLWLILSGLGIFAASRTLPRGVVYGAAWYFICGFVVLLVGAQDRQLSAWMMGVPFTIGQLLLAFVMHRTARGADAR